MTLPFEIHPLVWPYFVLAVGVLIWAYTRPPEHFFKQIWWSMVEGKAQAFQPLLGRHFRFDAERAAIAGRITGVLLIATCFGVAAASFGVWVGLFHNPPKPQWPAFDASHYEIIIEDHHISARRKAYPTTRGG